MVMSLKVQIIRLKVHSCDINMLMMAETHIYEINCVTVGHMSAS